MDWNWSNWIILHADLIEEENTSSSHHSIGITGEFNLNRFEIPYLFCNFEMGVIGGTLSLTTKTGHIPAEDCWGNAGDYATDNGHNPFRLHHVHLNGSDTNRQWLIEHQQNWQKSPNKIVPIKGRIDLNQFAQLVNDNSEEKTVDFKPHFEIKPYHLVIPPFKKGPFLERYGKQTPNQMHLLVALLRQGAYQKLGGKVSFISHQSHNNGNLNRPTTTENVDHLFGNQQEEKLIPLLEKANLPNDCIRGMCLKDTDLQDENFTNYDLRSCNFFLTRFQKATFNNTELDHANLRNAELHGTKFLGKTSLKQADLSYAQMPGIEFPSTIKAQGANLRRANLTDAKLNHVDFQGCCFSEAILIIAELRGANLSGCDLSNANLMGADLTGANLIDANLTGAKFDSATKLQNADVSGANFDYVDLYTVDLTGLNLEKADLKRVFRDDFEKFAAEYPALRVFASEKKKLEQELAELLKELNDLLRRFDN